MAANTLRNEILLHPLFGFIWLHKDLQPTIGKSIESNRFSVLPMKSRADSDEGLRSHWNDISNLASASSVDRRSVDSVEELRRLKEQLNQLQGVSRSQLIKKINDYFRRPEFVDELRSVPKLGKEFFG
jgi:hypothetical protein